MKHPASIEENPVVVTGVGAFAAAATTADELWQRAVCGHSPAVARVFDALEVAVCSAADPPHEVLARTRFHKLDRCHQLALMAADEAWNQADLSPGTVDPRRIGVAVGTSRGPVETIMAATAFTGKKLPPSLAAAATLGGLSGSLAQHFGASGPATVLSATCVSAAAAIIYAAQQILLGAADVMIAGGTEAPLESSVIRQLHRTGILGSAPDPANTCRPFDTYRNGTILGEGAGFLVLESMASARKRGATILGVLAGWSSCSDRGGRAGMEDDGIGLRRVIQDSMAMAGATPAEIACVNAHGTGTRLNDSVEGRVLAAIFAPTGGPAPSGPPISSTKPVTGHCLGATPALEAIIALHALNEQLAPPTAACSTLDPDCRIRPVLRAARPCRGGFVMTNSSGFWGHHAALLFARDTIS